jgi:asparagine synthase (glutamine-hydrolysing)
MCGIFGVWQGDGRPVDTGALVRATAALRHRGPDDEGYLIADTHRGTAVAASGDDTSPELGLPHVGRVVPGDLAFGFRRLSILDLSPAGHQPMASADGRFWLVFNGEIYNYVELRHELEGMGHSFRSGSDSEVLLAAHAAWGRDCLARLNGMWAFAIWDVRERTLFLSRDRFGIKPLLYARVGQTIAFSSEAKALLAAGIVPFAPDEKQLQRFLETGLMPSPSRGETFFANIAAVPPAHSLLISRASVELVRYWSIPHAETDAETDVSTDRAIEEYSDLFHDAVRLNLRADVPVGTCLSGGLDSSSIVASIARAGRIDQRTFSAVYDSDGRWNEREQIDRVLRSVDVQAVFTRPTRESLWEDLPALAHSQEEPFETTSIFAQWCVMRAARQAGVTVLLDGQGADEILAGYQDTAFPSYALDTLLRDGPGAGLRAMREYGVRLPALVRAFAHRFPTDARYRNLDELLRYQMTERLPLLLRYEDRSSMAFSIEARVPFLDHRLVEYVFRSAAGLRVRDGWSKWLQRKAIDGALPSVVVWSRDKIGFETPQSDWLRASGRELAEWKGEAARRLDVDRHWRGPAAIWRVVSATAWLRAMENGATIY